MGVEFFISEIIRLYFEGLPLAEAIDKTAHIIGDYKASRIIRSFGKVYKGVLFIDEIIE